MKTTNTITITIEAPGLHDALLAIAEGLTQLGAIATKTGAAEPGPAVTYVTPAPPVVPPQQQQPTAAQQQPTAAQQMPIAAPQQQQPTAAQQMPIAAPQQQAPAYTQMPTAAPQQQAPAYTQMQLAKAGNALRELDPVDGTRKLLAILAEMGVQALTQLDKAQYPDFAARLRSEGVDI